MSRTCYMCDAVATSVEHVPPKCLFPAKKYLPDGADLRRQLITVPACEIHNGEKSKDDEYILYVLVMSIPSNEIAKNLFLRKIVKAIEEKPSLINQFMKNNQPVFISDSKTGDFFQTKAVEIDRKRFCSAIEYIARALYFFEFGEKLRGEVRIQPDFLLSLDHDKARKINEPIEKLAKLADQLFSEIPPKGENQSVFKYKVIDGNHNCKKIMRLYFYNGSKVTVFCGIQSGEVFESSLPNKRPREKKVLSALGPKKVNLINHARVRRKYPHVVTRRSVLRRLKRN